LKRQILSRRKYAMLATDHDSQILVPFFTR
jgi:hypothetical protein